MKKLFTLLGIALVIAFSVSAAFADGRADLPAWALYSEGNSWHDATYFFSNRSDKEITVTMKFRDMQGAAITDAIAKVNEGSYVGADNVEFTIPARGGAKLLLWKDNQKTWMFGGGEISWRFTDETYAPNSATYCKPLSVLIGDYQSMAGNRSHGAFPLQVNGDIWF